MTEAMPAHRLPQDKLAIEKRIFTDAAAFNGHRDEARCRTPLLRAAGARREFHPRRPEYGAGKCRSTSMMLMFWSTIMCLILAALRSASIAEIKTASVVRTSSRTFSSVVARPVPVHRQPNRYRIPRRPNRRLTFVLPAATSVLPAATSRWIGCWRFMADEPINAGAIASVISG